MVNKYKYRSLYVTTNIDYIFCYDFCGRLITAVDTDMVRNSFITFLKRFMKTYSSFCIAAHDLIRNGFMYIGLHFVI